MKHPSSRLSLCWRDVLCFNVLCFNLLCFNLLWLSLAMPAKAQTCDIARLLLRGGNPGTVSAELQATITGTCSEDATLPSIDFVRKQGRRIEIHLDQSNRPLLPGVVLGPPWALRTPLGRLAPGTNTVAVMAPDGPNTVEVLSQTLEVKPPPCDDRREPGATLLFPFVEVDLEDPEGLSTLVSINNAAAAPTLARAVLWTNWNLPVLAFDLYLEGHDVLTLNLRDVLEGRFPQTGTGLDPRAFPGCSSPLASPQLDEDAVRALQAKMRGLPDPSNGLCLAAEQEPGATVTGMLTVDVLQQCPGDALYPTESGYFEAEGEGVAGDFNTLWGDFFFLDRGDHAASGFEAITVHSIEPGVSGRFYPTPHSHRRQLPSEYHSRFLRGGSFTGETELLVWIGYFPRQAAGYTCGTSGPLRESFSDLEFRYTDEDGFLPRNRSSAPFDSFVERLHLSEGGIHVHETRAGLVELATIRNSSLFVYPIPLQSAVLTLLKADGRFSVGYTSTPAGSYCR